MDAETIITALEEQFPGKTILRLPEVDPTEVICEVEPTKDHPEYSTAVAYVEESAPHRHPDGVETYKVEHGILLLTVEGQQHVLRPSDELAIAIQPGQLHSATGIGGATRVRVSSVPGWTFENHILESPKE